MPRRLPLAALLTLCATCIAVPAATAGGWARHQERKARAALSSHNPSRAQVRAAVARVRRSRRLWATVNRCAPAGHPHTVGVRAQMPALGFPARLSMSIRIDYWDPRAHRYVPDLNRGGVFVDRLGIVSYGYEQGGYTVALHGFAGRVRASVTFRWQRRGKLLLALTRSSTRGHPDADLGIPAHHSAAACRLRAD